MLLLEGLAINIHILESFNKYYGSLEALAINIHFLELFNKYCYIWNL